MLAGIAKEREKVLGELQKIIDHAKAAMKQGAWAEVIHHWRDADERDGIDPTLVKDTPHEKVCIGSTIKIMWDVEK